MGPITLTSQGYCEDGVTQGMSRGCTQWVLNIHDLPALLSSLHRTMVLTPLECPLSDLAVPIAGPIAGPAHCLI